MRDESGIFHLVKVVRDDYLVGVDGVDFKLERKVLGDIVKYLAHHVGLNREHAGRVQLAEDNLAEVLALNNERYVGMLADELVIGVGVAHNLST